MTTVGPVWNLTEGTGITLTAAGGKDTYTVAATAAPVPADIAVNCSAPLDLTPAPGSVAGTWTLDQVFYGWSATNTSKALNDAATWSIYLTAGTYTVSMAYWTAPDAGIVSPKLDGVLIPSAAIDCYSASYAPAYNGALKSLLTVAASGVKAIQFLVASKNASSSAYAAYIDRLSFLRTA